MNLCVEALTTVALDKGERDKRSENLSLMGKKYEKM